MKKAGGGEFRITDFLPRVPQTRQDMASLVRLLNAGFGGRVVKKGKETG